LQYYFPDNVLAEYFYEYYFGVVSYEISCIKEFRVILEYILVSLLIGFVSGVFGIGGSIISTPVLKIFFGLPDLIALASPLPVTIPTALSGVYGYWKSGAINKRIALLTLVGGMPATIFGALGTKIIAGQWLMLLRGILIILVGIRLIKTGKPLPIELKNDKQKVVLGLIAGIMVGILSGLLAVGGGIVMVPIFILLFGLTMQEAAATSLLCLAFLAIPGTLTHWYLGNIDWYLVMIFTIGVIPASYLGSKFAMKVKSGPLQVAFSIFIILFGIYFILDQMY